jgi:hypothetical protein
VAKVKFVGIRCEPADRKALAFLVGALGMRYASWLRQTIRAQYRCLTQNGKGIAFHAIEDTSEMRSRLAVSLAVTLGDQEGVVNQMVRVLVADYEEWLARRLKYDIPEIVNFKRIYDTQISLTEKEAHDHILQSTALSHTDWLLKSIHAQVGHLRRLGIKVHLPEYDLSDSAAASSQLAITLAATANVYEQGTVDRLLRVLLSEQQYSDWIEEYNAAHIINWIAHPALRNGSLTVSNQRL